MEDEVFTPMKLNKSGISTHQLSIKTPAIMKKELVMKTYKLPIAVIVFDERTGSWYFKKGVRAWRLNQMIKCTEAEAMRYLDAL